MNVLGTLLTETEEKRVRSPFSRNSGVEWTLAKMKECVDLGAEEVIGDQNRKATITQTIDALKDDN